MTELSWVAQAGLVYLAFAALSGWLMVIVVDKPQWLTARGVRAPGRFRQAHIDWILMALILMAVGVALPELATVWQVLLVGSAIINPTMFLPLAFRPELKDSLWYRGLAILSFLAMSVATVATAVTALG